MSTATTIPTIGRYTLTAGTVDLTVKPSETFILARRLLGDDYHDEYTYRLVNDHDRVLWLSTLTYPKNSEKPPKWVYTGMVDLKTGAVRLTTKSAFPATATRVKVANRVLMALFAGRAADVEKAGWTVTAEVVNELPDRF